MVILLMLMVLLMLMLILMMLILMMLLLLMHPCGLIRLDIKAERFVIRCAGKEITQELGCVALAITSTTNLVITAATTCSVGVASDICTLVLSEHNWYLEVGGMKGCYLRV